MRESTSDTVRERKTNADQSEEMSVDRDKQTIEKEIRRKRQRERRQRQRRERSK